MLKKVLKFILNKLRYIVGCLVVGILAMLLSPIILIFKWRGIWVLAVANEEGCSLEEAGRMLDEGTKYEYERHGVWKLDQEGRRIPRSAAEFVSVNIDSLSEFKCKTQSNSLSITQDYLPSHPCHSTYLDRCRGAVDH